MRIVLLAVVLAHFGLSTRVLPAVEAGSDTHIVRTKASALDAGRAGQRLPLELGLGRHLEGRIDRAYDTVLGSRVVTGKLLSEGGGRFLLVGHGEVVAGAVFTSEATLTIVPLGNGYSMIEAVGDAPVEADSIAVDYSHLLASNRPAKRRVARPVAAEDDPVIDVLALTTKKAEQAIGGRHLLLAALDFQVEFANLALENSEVPGRFRLVAVKPARYNELDDSLDTFRDLTNGTTRLFKRAKKFGRRKGAEFVTVVAATDVGFCGWGNLPGPVGLYEDPDFLESVQNIRGFSFKSAMAVRCLRTRPRLFAHEIGHNLQNCHEHELGPGPTCRPYAHGYNSPDLSVRTVMTATTGTSYRYSNPEVEDDGVPTGVPRGQREAADVAHNLRKVLPIASQMVACKVDCPPQD